MLRSVEGSSVRPFDSFELHISLFYIPVHIPFLLALTRLSHRILRRCWRFSLRFLFHPILLLIIIIFTGHHPLKLLRRLPRKLTLTPYFLPVPIKQEWKRHTHKRQKSRDAARPVDTQVAVHLICEEREAGAEEGSKDRVGGEDAGGVNGVGVDEVVHDGEEDEYHAEAEGGGADDTYGPVDGGVVGPGEPLGRKC